MAARRDWLKKPVKYRGAHARVRAFRGPATDYKCVDCPRQATQWSYRGGSAHEMSEPWTLPHGAPTVVRYSIDPRDYDPRCKACHVSFDKLRVNLTTNERG